MIAFLIPFATGIACFCIGLYFGFKSGRCSRIDYLAPDMSVKSPILPEYHTTAQRVQLKHTLLLAPGASWSNKCAYIAAEQDRLVENLAKQLVQSGVLSIGISNSETDAWGCDHVEITASILVAPDRTPFRDTCEHSQSSAKEPGS